MARLFLLLSRIKLNGQAARLRPDHLRGAAYNGSGRGVEYEGMGLGEACHWISSRNQLLFKELSVKALKSMLTDDPA